MLRAATGETFGRRPSLLALTVVRVFIAATTLLQERQFTGPASVGHIVQGAIFAWAALAVVGTFLNFPRSRASFVVLLVFDWAFAIGVLAFGAPIAGLLLLLFDEIVLRACGWRWSPAIVILPYGLVVLMLRFAEAWWGLNWSHFDIVPSDILVWAAILSVYAVTLHLAQERRTSLERLGGDIWIDPILAADQPFSYDFDKWVDQIAKLFGGPRCICLLALTQRLGPLRVFSNVQAERFQFELAKALGPVREQLPQELEVVRDRETKRRDNGAIEQLHLLGMLDHSVIMLRTFRLGHQHGILVIAHNQPNDAILHQEEAIIDRALDNVVERVGTTMEMRRAFLAEAREVARRDLHDGVLQSLAALRMRLLTIIQAQDIAQSPSAAEIRNTAEIIALEQARLRTLLDKTVDDDQAVNLVEALRLCVKTTALQWEINIEFEADDTVIPMHRESTTNVEYLVREVIANATKHSGSEHLRCALALRDDNLTITLMDLSATPATLNNAQLGPMASQSLRQRLALVNGRAYSEGLQTGTLLAIAIPLIYDENDI